MPISIGRKNFPRPIKLHSEVVAIRLCLASLEEDARREGYDLAVVCIKTAQSFLYEEYCTRKG